MQIPVLESVQNAQAITPEDTAFLALYHSLQEQKP